MISSKDRSRFTEAAGTRTRRLPSGCYHRCPAAFARLRGSGQASRSISIRLVKASTSGPLFCSRLMSVRGIQRRIHRLQKARDPSHKRRGHRGATVGWRKHPPGCSLTECRFLARRRAHRDWRSALVAPAMSSASTTMMFGAPKVERGRGHRTVEPRRRSDCCCCRPNTQSAPKEPRSPPKPSASRIFQPMNSMMIS